MDLAQLTRSAFDELRNTEFTIGIDDRVVTLELTEVTALARHEGHTRDPFSLVFQADAELAQGTYRLEHHELDVIEIFMVPIGANEQGSRLEAIFN